MNKDSSPSSIVPNNAPIGLSTDPPYPPNWNVNLDNTAMSLVPYKLFPVAADTLEYRTIATLLDPFKIKTVEQIVNPALWTRFVNTRKDMLLSKSDDLSLLCKLLSDEKKILQHTHNVLNYDKHDRVAACPYDDNVALLFHCTRDKRNVDTILLQGLDERVANGGTLGRGIYFACDHLKSMTYDGCGGTLFIFMVILGDCLTVDRENIRNFVREPEKVADQQRTLTDISFDSIVGNPGAACEFVIYNRYQCCPLYKISYDRSTTGTGPKNSKNHLPPFSWTSKSSTAGSIAMPPSTSECNWSFFAKTIFSQMGVPQIQDEDIDVVPEVTIEESDESIQSKMTVLTDLGFPIREINYEILKNNSFDLDRTINHLLEQSGGDVIDESEILKNNKLTTLLSLGFSNAELNAELLKKNSYDLNKCVNELIEQDVAVSHIDQDSEFQCDGLNEVGQEPISNVEYSEFQPDGFNEAAHEPISNVQVKVSKSSQDCPICSGKDVSAENWILLQCGHKLCSQCYKQIEMTRTTMTGVTFTFTKCPSCRKTSGIEVGSCPHGVMTTSIVSTPCDGLERYQSIRIEYYIEDQNHQLNRIAYLPKSDEGNDLLKLLRIAWDRRIIFTIETSGTDGREDVLVWNIHHKTAQSGGNESFPDDTYIERCRLELKAFGIE